MQTDLHREGDSSTSYLRRARTWDLVDLLSCAQRSMQSGEKTQQPTQARTRLVRLCIYSEHLATLVLSRRPEAAGG